MAQCQTYSVAAGPATFIPGTTDIGNHADDLGTAVPLPFPVTLYGTTASTGFACSNGHFKFGAVSTAFTNACPITATSFTGETICPYWDDLRTDGTGQGIFTATIGSAPNRKFVIEWRAGFFSGCGATGNFEIIFTEGSSNFDVVIASGGTCNGNSASCGVTQGATGGFVTNYPTCNTAWATPNLSLRFTCVTPSSGACCDITGACAVTTSISCASPSLYAGAGSTCNASAPLCPIAGIGSCCSVTTAACTYVSSAASCASPNTYSAGGVCTPNSCAPVGSCCVNSSCTTTIPANCTGLFAGPNTTCTTNPCPPPGNDNCNLPMPAPYHFTTNFTVSGDATTATSDGSFAGIAGGTFGCAPTNTTTTTNSGKEVYFSFTPSANGTLNADLCSTVPSTDSVLSIHTGCPATAANTIGCNDDGACSAGVGLSQVVGVPVTAGTPYLIRVAHYGTASTTAYVYTLQVTTAAIGACCKPDASCIVATSAACTASPNNGSYRGNATTCGGVTCTGSCCDNSTAICTATAPNACASPSTFGGIGSSCSPSPCIGQACCSTSTGACTLVGNSGTCAAGSVSAGANTTCVPSPCTISTCCAASGACTVTGSDPCPSGTTANAATACTPTNPCPQPPPPANDLCANAQVLTLNVAATGSNVTATGDATEGTVPACQTSFGKSVWFTFTAPSSDVFGFTACGSNYDTVLSVFDGTCGALGTEVGCDDDTCDGVTPAGSTLASIIAPVALTAGHTYLVRLAGFGSATGNYTLTVTGTAPSGVCCRGATCNTTLASAAACTGSLVAGQTAGASFPAGAACNAGGSNTTPCCYADYNKVNGVGVQDIFDFLADWFAGSTFANTGGNGGPASLAVQNIFDFLTAWFAGGC